MTTMSKRSKSPVCQSGEATGESCSWSGRATELVTVEWMPEHLRSSHEAAGNWGRWPANGAVRLRCCPACAEWLEAEVACESSDLSDEVAS